MSQGVEKTTLGGLPAFRANVPGMPRCVLMFGVGYADETLRTRGITHLVEHMAAGTADRGHSFNAFVDTNRTAFYAQGSEAQLKEFLRSVTATLGDLPVARLADEIRILETEATGRRPSVEGELLTLRYGVTGYGLAEYNEFGLINLSPEELRGWARERFTRSNAVIWTTGDLEDLELDLPQGGASQSRQLVHARLPLPCWWERAGGVGLSALLPRTSAATTTMAILTRRLHDKLRHVEAISYQVHGNYLGLDSEQAHGYVWTDVLPANAQRAQAALLETSDELAANGATEPELQRMVNDFRQHVDEPEAILAQLDQAARNELMGRPFRPTAELLAEQEALSPADISGCWLDARQTGLYVVPNRTGMPPEMSGYPFGPWVDPVSGETLSSLIKGSSSRLILGEDGITSVTQKGRITVRFDNCAAAVWWYDGRRTLIGPDGWELPILPWDWDGGYYAVDIIDERVPPDRFVAAERRENAQSRFVRRHSSPRVLVILAIAFAVLALACAADVVTIAMATPGTLSTTDQYGYYNGLNDPVAMTTFAALLFVSSAAFALGAIRRTRKNPGRRKRTEPAV